MIMGINLLVTGGAGFIGSNLVEKFLSDERVDLVRVVDDLSTGYLENITEFESHPKFEFLIPGCKEHRNPIIHQETGQVLKQVYVGRVANVKYYTHHLIL